MVTASAPAPARPERILLVEDDEFSSQLIDMYLRKSGFGEITTARDGREALELARDTPFDLMLLDLNLPRLNGPEVLRRLKKDDALKQTAVLVISSLTNAEATANCMEHGAEDYLPKPFNKQLLENRVLSILNRRRLQADLVAAADGETKALAAARHLQSTAIRSVLAAGNCAGAAVMVPGAAFPGTMYEAVTLADGTRAVLMAEAAVPGLAGGLIALSARAHLHLARAEASADIAPEDLLARLELAMAGAADPVGGIRVALTLIDQGQGTIRRIGGPGLPAPLVVHQGGEVEMVRSSVPAPITFAPGDMLALPGAGVNQREGLGGSASFSLRARLAHHAARSPAEVAAALTAELSPAPAGQSMDLNLLLLSLGA